jgi:hypothetical protein
MSVDQALAWTPAEIVAVAKWERYVIFLILLELLSEIAMIGIALNSGNNASDAVAVLVLLIVVGRLAVLGLCIFGVYAMATALRKKMAVLYALGMLVPLVGLLVLLSLNSEAMSLLKAHGIRIGLMGANRDDVRRYVSQSDASQVRT